MIWYKDLFVGEKASKKKYRMLRKINKRFLTNAYVVTLPANNNNVLDVYSYNELLQKHYRNRDIYILGLACGKDEALDIVQKIVLDTYINTGAFKVADYLGIK